MLKDQICHLSQLWHDRLAFEEAIDGETSVFGAKFHAMKHGIENLRGICYKLRMMGIPMKDAS